MSNTSWAYRSRGGSGENHDDNGSGGKKDEGANKVLDAEEQLTNELFGTSNFLSRGANSGEIHGAESDGDESDDGETPGAQNGGGSLFYEDLGVSEEPTSTSVFTTSSSVKRKKVPAWQDEDDEDIRVSLTSANRLRKLGKLREKTKSRVLSIRNVLESNMQKCKTITVYPGQNSRLPAAVARAQTQFPWMTMTKGQRACRTPYKLQMP